MRRGPWLSQLSLSNPVMSVEHRVVAAVVGFGMLAVVQAADLAP
jgi:hypothetical protein